MKAGAVAWFALIKPWEINVLDPAVLFTTFYTGLVYAIIYSYFESFPLVFPVDYGFSTGTTALVFLTFSPALVISLAIWYAYFYWYHEGRMKTGKLGPPEERLVPGLYASFLLPIGLFLFGGCPRQMDAFHMHDTDGAITAWTSRPSIHWIAPCFGIGIATGGVFLVIQCIFLYLPFTYPKYAASLFAANNFARSALACGAVLFSRPMFDKLGIAGGVSLLAGLTLVCVVGFFMLYFFGASLRARSRFAVS